MLPLHHGPVKADDVGRTGLPGVAQVLFRLSHVREVVRPAGVEPAASAFARQRSRPLSYGRLCEEPPAGVEPAPRPYDGRVLAVDTTEARSGDGGSRTRSSSVQARRPSPWASSPCELVSQECGGVGVEPPQAEAAGLQPAELPAAQRPRERAADRIRTGTARITTSDAAVTPQPPRLKRGRPDSNRRPIA